MSTATPNKLMTAEEFLALPEDPGVERELIQGEVWEREMTKRSKKHSATQSMIVFRLLSWVQSQRIPHGTVASGEAGCFLRRNPDSVVGIDVAFFSAEAAQRNGKDTTLFDSPPVLAVEILSPSDKHDLVDAKIQNYLEANVSLVWIVDPTFKTVTVYRPDAKPEMFSGDDEISGEPHLPGFTLPVSQLFQF